MSHQPSKSNEELIEYSLSQHIAKITIHGALEKLAISHTNRENLKQRLIKILEVKDAETKKAVEEGVRENSDKLWGEGYTAGILYERNRIEEIFKKHVPPHAMDLEDSVWLKRLLNKAFNHIENI